MPDETEKATADEIFARLDAYEVLISVLQEQLLESKAAADKLAGEVQALVEQLSKGVYAPHFTVVDAEGRPAVRIGSNECGGVVEVLSGRSGETRAALAVDGAGAGRLITANDAGGVHLTGI